MKVVKIILLGITALSVSAAAQAQDSNAYVNIGVKTYELDIFARAGYSTVNFHVEGIGVQTADFNADGFSVGGGLQYNISDLKESALGIPIMKAIA